MPEMSTIHFFNPESEAELSDGNPGYTPSRAARIIAEAGALLPLWWANPGDIVISPPGARRLKAELSRRLGLCDTENAPTKIDHAAPWGWSQRAARVFEKRGVSCDLIPDMEIIAGMSRRSTAIEIRQLLGVESGEEHFDIDKLTQYISDSNGQVIIKAPLSCSGRGIIDCRITPPSVVINRARAIFRHQGSVITERALDKQLDFAALFEAVNSDIEFVGWSLFNTGTGGNYQGNIVAPQNEFAKQLSKAESWIEPLRQALKKTIAPYYNGPLGVDMMFYGKDLKVMPCIEVNLRRTMGFVAHDLAERHGLRGHLVFDPHPDGPGLTLSASETARFAIL